MTTWSSWAPSVAIACMCAIVFQKLHAEIERQKLLRHSERQGRIKAETALAGSVSDTPSLSVYPIGYVRSVFSKRNGTPRQPGLVISAEAIIEIIPALNQAVDSIESYSHIWIMFEFSGNTNRGKRMKAAARGKPFDGLKLLVEPPKAEGLKVGVLSCRTPHRPNPIGLSLCKLLRVEDDNNQTGRDGKKLKGKRLIVAGLDCLDGTPIIDIKPYLPQIESIPAAKVPDWIYQGIDKDKELVVEWDNSVCMQDSQLRAIITQTLSSDIRSRNQISQGSSSLWKLCIANLNVEYSIDDNKLVTIKSIT